MTTAPPDIRSPDVSFRCSIRGFGLDPTRSIWIILALGVGLSLILERIWKAIDGTISVAPAALFMLCMVLGTWIQRIAEDRHIVELGEHGLRVVWRGAGRLRPSREIPYHGIVHLRKAGRQIVLNLGHGDSVRLKPRRIMIEDLIDAIEQRIEASRGS